MSMELFSRGCVSGGILSLHTATHTMKTHQAGEDEDCLLAWLACPH